jgi:hypothetical protein
MNVTEISTHYGWHNNQLSVTEYKTEHFDKGNDVRSVVQRFYNVVLYDSRGKVNEVQPKGSNFDKAV